MRNPDRRTWILVAIVCLVAAGCASTNMPRNWLGDPAERSYDGYGGWIDIRCGERLISGELIAVTLDSLFVADSSFRSIPSTEITSARLVTYAPSNVSGLVLLGTLSTLSNGGYLIFTAPLWIVFGSITAAGRYGEALTEYPERPLVEMTRFARFPQGLPATLDHATIRTRPYTP